MSLLGSLWKSSWISLLWFLLDKKLAFHYWFFLNRTWGAIGVALNELRFALKLFCLGIYLWGSFERKRLGLYLRSLLHRTFGFTVGRLWDWDTPLEYIFEINTLDLPLPTKFYLPRNALKFVYLWEFLWCVLWLIRCLIQFSVYTAKWTDPALDHSGPDDAPEVVLRLPVLQEDLSNQCKDQRIRPELEYLYANKRLQRPATPVINRSLESSFIWHKVSQSTCNIY